MELSSSQSVIREISPKALSEMLHNGEQVELIDVREPFERDICTIGGSLIPLGSLAEEIDSIPRDRMVVIYCRSGGRSGQAVLALQKVFNFDNLYNLSGGILAWAKEVDPALPTY